ncbi:response regulator [Polyangium aurulentum]|nr:response regulator [Polyangium aurulentum]
MAGVVMFLDVTEQRRYAQEREELLASERAARAEAERASRLKDDFLATVSHELRTPLNAILGYAQLLRHGVMPAHKVSDGLEVIERNARIQTQIIEDILDMSRIVSGKMRLDVQRVELSSVIEAAMDTVRPAADARGIRLIKTLDPLTGPIAGDPSRLQQVVWNLLTNAIKFTPKGGLVQVVLERINSHLEVSVSDNGPGIKPEFLPHVFDKFRQADASTTRKHGGLGLGLAIVRNLVEMHGGSVRVHSEGEGKGATFTVALPVSAVHASPESEERVHPRSPSMGMPLRDRPSLSSVTVLVVDDEPDARELVRRLLEDCGARVTTAGSAQEALDLLDRERVDVLVSDIGMPGEDGYELVRRVRARGPGRQGGVPAAALTAFARSEDRTRALRAGYQTHISKPVEPMELLFAVASLAGKTGSA